MPLRLRSGQALLRDLIRLCSSEGGEDVRGDYADAEEDAGGGQDEDYRCRQQVCPQRADQVSHDLSVVYQHEEEYQRWRHGEDCDYIYYEDYVDQGQAWN